MTDTTIDSAPRGEAFSGAPARIFVERGRGAGGGFLETDQLLEAMLPTVISKQAMQFSVRYLIGHGSSARAARNAGVLPESATA